MIHESFVLFLTEMTLKQDEMFKVSTDFDECLYVIGGWDKQHVMSHNLEDMLRSDGSP